MTILPRDFYARDTLVVARELLGQVLCRSIGDVVLRGRIVETEAYTQEDPASHAFRGCTPRTKAMFQQPGTVYVYFIYGMYHCLNIVTDSENYGSAVLVRALEGLGGLSGTSGPGKLCRAMAIDLDCNGQDLTNRNGNIWVEYSTPILPKNVVQTTRVGIRRATNYPWRFYVRNNRFVSTFSSNNQTRKR
ncbi:MAG: DNA-3-methyladenine glycosylase [Puniceicoccales bacterium]|jgi:DNA-3-methyladenine glycosylase|nr:DNA-3-methyladenine glycosylase [Puniceicoccales bacterium]